MKQLTISLSCLLALLLCHCTPPLPEIRDHTVGKWSVSSDIYILYESGQELLSLKDLKLELLDDGSLIVHDDPAMVGSWLKPEPFALTLSLPENGLFPGSGPSEFDLYQITNYTHYLGWRGGGYIVQDTGRVYLDFYDWSMTRVR